MTATLDPHAMMTAREFIEATEPEVLDLLLDPDAPDAFEEETDRAAKMATRYDIEPDNGGRLPAWVFEASLG